MTSARIELEAYADLVGTTVGTSEWFVLDQSRIDQFAQVTEDRQFIHTDPVAARETPFGGTIAHGFLSLSLLSAMAVTGLPKIAAAKLEINYGFNRVRFLKPVLAGKRVRGVFVLAAIEERAPGQWLSTLNVTIEIEHDETPAAVVEWLYVASL